jgi:hypothetical protein
MTRLKRHLQRRGKRVSPIAPRIKLVEFALAKTWHGGLRPLFFVKKNVGFSQAT